MVNKEFIAAKDLPVTDAAEVNVLCVDNGELKQKPAGNLGGGGGYVIKVAIDEIVEAGSNAITIESKESYDNYIDILLNGGSVWVDATAIYADGMQVEDATMRLAMTAFSFAIEDGVPVVMLMGFAFINTLMIVQLMATGTKIPELN